MLSDNYFLKVQHYPLHLLFLFFLFSLMKYERIFLVPPRKHQNFSCASRPAHDVFWPAGRFKCASPTQTRSTRSCAVVCAQKVMLVLRVYTVNNFLARCPVCLCIFSDLQTRSRSRNMAIRLARARVRLSLSVSMYLFFRDRLRVIDVVLGCVMKLLPIFPNYRARTRATAAAAEAAASTAVSHRVSSAICGARIECANMLMLCTEPASTYISIIYDWMNHTKFS